MEPPQTKMEACKGWGLLVSPGLNRFQPPVAVAVSDALSANPPVPKGQPKPQNGAAM